MGRRELRKAFSKDAAGTDRLLAVELSNVQEEQDRFPVDGQVT
jgi:hypothetical protein